MLPNHTVVDRYEKGVYVTRRSGVGPQAHPFAVWQMDSILAFAPTLTKAEDAAIAYVKLGELGLADVR